MSTIRKLENKATPGPWRVYVGYNFVRVIDLEAREICTVAGIDQFTKVDGRKDKTTLSNALLIASVPDLCSEVDQFLAFIREKFPEAFKYSTKLQKALLTAKGDKNGKVL